MRPLLLILFLSGLILLPSLSYSQDTLYWLGATSTEWANGANWTDDPGVASTVSPPASGTVVILNSSTTYNCVLDVNASISKLVIDNGSSLDLNGYDLSVQGDLEQLGSTFIGGSGDITVGGLLHISGGTFISTSGTLSLEDGILQELWETFDANSGLVKITGEATIDMYDFLYDLEVASGAELTLDNHLPVLNSAVIEGPVIANSRTFYLANSSSAAVSGSSGVLLEIGEFGLGMFIWAVGEQQATYSIPVLSSLGGSVIPVEFDITTPGVGEDASLLLASAFVSSSKPQDLFDDGKGFYSESGGDNSSMNGNRVWFFLANDFEEQPVLDITLNYDASIISGISLTEANIQGQYFDETYWSDLWGSVDVVNDRLVIYDFIPPGTDVASIWCLVDNTSKNYTVYGGNTGADCDYAVEVAAVDQPQQLRLVDEELWIEVDPSDGDLLQFDLDIEGAVNVESIELYTGACSTLTLDATYTIKEGETEFKLVSDEFKGTDPIYLKVVGEGRALFEVELKKGFPIVWNDQTNITNVLSNGLEGIGAVSNEMGGASKNFLASGEDGYVEFEITDMSMSDGPVIGLSRNDLSLSSYSIQYGMHQAWSDLEFWVNGASISSTSILLGDVCRIERSGNSIIWSINGSTVYTVSTDNSSELVIDVTMGPGTTEIDNIVTNIGSSFGITAEVTPKTTGCVMSGEIKTFLQGGYAPYTYSWSDGATSLDRYDLRAGEYSITVTDRFQQTATASFNVGAEMEWTNETDVDVLHNSINHIGNATYTSGASSLNYLIPEKDGYLEGHISKLVGADSDLSFGFVTEDNSLSSSEILYGFDISASNGLSVIEQGVQQWNTSTMNIGDKLRVTREGGYIRYYVNGVQVRQVSTDNTLVLYADFALGNNKEAELRAVTLDLEHVLEENALYWIGASDGIWDNGANWSLKPFGTAASLVPDNTTYGAVIVSEINDQIELDDDVDVLFLKMFGDGTSSIDCAGYDLNVSGVFTMEGGTFISGSGLVDVGGYLNIYGGSFTATDATMTVKAIDMLDVANYFHNNGTVVLTGDGTINAFGYFYDVTVEASADMVLSSSFNIENGLVIDGTIDLANSDMTLYNNSAEALSFGSSGGIKASGYDLSGAFNWWVGPETNTYEVVFMDESSIAIGTSIDIVSSGVGNEGYLSFSTFSTEPTLIPNNNPAPLGVSNTNPYETLDRYWYVGAENYHQAPVYDLTIHYNDAIPAGNNSIVEADLEPFIWKGDGWESKAFTLDQVNNKVTIAGQEDYSVWVLSTSTDMTDNAPGTDCASAEVLTGSTGLPLYAFENEEFWMKIVTDDTQLDLSLYLHNQEPITSYIDQITIYDGSCGTLSQVDESTFGGYSQTISHTSTGLLSSHLYYIKFHKQTLLATE